MFKRNLYFSQTELQKTYKGKLTLNQIKTIIKQFKIPVLGNEVNMRYAGAAKFYSATTRYILKSDWQKAITDYYNQ